MSWTTVTSETKTSFTNTKANFAKLHVSLATSLSKLDHPFLLGRNLMGSAFYSPLGGGDY